MRSRISWIALVLVMAGCGVSTPQSSVPLLATPATPTVGLPLAPTSAPSPTAAPPLSVDQLSGSYLACAATFNAALSKVNDDLAAADKAHATLKKYKAIYKRLADLIGTFAGCIRSIAWTPTFKDDVHAVLQADSTQQITALAMSQVKSFNELNSLSKTLAKQNLAASSAANLLRGDLGLPPPPPV